jgi:hypothetical protein
MLQFNKFGYLEPNSAIPSTIKEFETIFVIEYSSVERSNLFEQYLRYIKDLKQICGNMGFKHWINGSFVTKNKPRPNDIDIVVFIDTEIFNKLGDELRPFAYPKSKENYPGIDAYLVESFANEEPTIFKSDKAYWFQQFSKTRRNKRGVKVSKGFLEIIY